MTIPGPTKFQYRDTWYRLAPPWLRTGVAEKFMYTMQLATDLLVDKAWQATAIRFPGQGDASQIPFLANDRLLIQGPAETDALFIQRLRQAFETWKKAGSAASVLGQLQAFMQGLQPGVSAVLPEIAIVGGYHPTVTRWQTTYQGNAIGAPPTLQVVKPSNFNWDGNSQAWRAWLVMYMALVATGQAGSSGQTTTASGPNNGLGQNVNGVWVPNTVGSPLNTPFLTLTGLSGLTGTETWIVITGSTHPGNNGIFPITSHISSSSCVVANPNGVTSDAGPLTWAIVAYPFIGPGPVWGQTGIVFGQGESFSTTPPSVPPLDTGSNVGGVWGPTTPGTFGCTLSWGLNCPSTTIAIFRLLLKRWKSGATYYPNIIIAFDGNTGAPGSAYSPNSSPGSGNPDGTFGPVGKLVSGVWVPTRLISSTFDTYCQGTGSHQSCSVENIT